LLQAVEDISATKKRLKIEIPADVIEGEIQNSLERLRQNSRIPGFRPGKVPMNIIEKRFVKKVEAEVLEKVIPEFYRKALREAELMPVTMPELDGEFDFKRNNPIHLSFTVEVIPKIDTLNYAGIKTKEIPVTVDDAEIEDFLKRLQEEKAIYEVAEKEVGKDDLVTFDYVDLEVVGEELTPSLREQMVKMDTKILPLDVEEKLLGKKKGDTIEVTNTFREDFRVKELAGKTAKVKITIKEIKRKILPELDDEFAKDLSYESLQALREQIRERIYKAKGEEVLKIQKANILNTIIASHDFEVPETALRNEIQSLMVESRIPEGEKHGGEKGENIDVPQELRERASRNVKATILLNAIGQKERVTVTDEEVKERINGIAQRLSAKPEAIMKFYITRDGSLEGLRHSIYEDKILDILFSKALFEKGE